MKNKTMNEVASVVKDHWPADISDKITNTAFARYKQLCIENNSVCRAKKKHYMDNIFPCISYYESLQTNGISKQDALNFLDKTWSKRAQKGADSTKSMLKHFGLYKLYPAMFKFVAKNQFGEKAGFKATFYKSDKKQCKFDMTRCLFLDTCKKYGCPELTICFCHTDDINNDNLHPDLCWNRTKYMGNGGDLCDFDIYVRKSKQDF